jgi:hypothetical protein
MVSENNGSYLIHIHGDAHRIFIITHDEGACEETCEIRV